MSVFSYLWLFPILASSLAFIGMLIPHVIGQAEKHIGGISFISDGGAYSPEGSIFSLLLNLSAFFLYITIYIRHQHIHEFYGRVHCRPQRWWRIANWILTVLSLVAVTGLMMIASFSEVEVPVVHGISATVTFLFALIYLAGQVYISLALRPMMSSWKVTWFRLFLVFISGVSLILHEVSLRGQVFVPAGTPPMDIPKETTVIFLDPSSPYYANYTVGTVAEWTMVMAFFVFVMTISFDLHGVSIDVPRLHLSGTASNRVVPTFVGDNKRHSCNTVSSGEP